MARLDILLHFEQIMVSWNKYLWVAKLAFTNVETNLG